MRSWLGLDLNYGSRFCVPIVTRDDGTPLSKDEQLALYPTINFFSQGSECEYGEKSVYHAQVRDYHFYVPPEYAGKLSFRLIKRQPGWYEEYDVLCTSTFNTVEFTYCYPNYENFTSWKRVRYSGFVNPIRKGDRGVTLGNCEWWYSPDLAAAEGVPTHFVWKDRYGTDTGCFVLLSSFDGDWEKSFLTREQAEAILNQVATSHTVPAGLVSELYREAMNSITCNTNTIANIAEVVGIIKDVKSGNIGSLVSDLPDLVKKKQFKKAAASSWLGYRYAYNTTKSDIEEYKEKLASAIGNKKGSHIVRSGSVLPEGEMHVRVSYSDRALNAAQSLYVMLKRTGLCLDPYAVWDMIPLSFVADWFLPIGDFLEDFSSNWVANTAIFDIHTVTTSWKWSETIRDTHGGYDISYYSRSVSTEPPEFESYSEDPSTKTVLKRVVDAAALIVG